MIVSLPSNTKDPSAGDRRLIPLINIVFLLLAFFMIAGQIEESDPRKVDLPNSASEHEQSEVYHSIIHFTSDANLFVDGELTERPELAQKILRTIDEVGGDIELQVSIRVDANLPALQLRSILEDLRTTGLNSVTVATKPDRTILKSPSSPSIGIES